MAAAAAAAAALALMTAAPVVAQELPMVSTKAPRIAELKERREALRSEIIVGQQELEKYSYTSLGELLKTLPGVSYSGPPGQIKDVRMRGMDKGYTEILINGEPVLSGTKEMQLQTDRIPLDLVELIEVLRAPVAGESGGRYCGHHQHRPQAIAGRHQYRSTDLVTHRLV